MRLFNHAQNNHDLHNSPSNTNTSQRERSFIIRLNMFQSGVNTVSLLNNDQHHYYPCSTMRFFRKDDKLKILVGILSLTESKLIYIHYLKRKVFP